MKYDKDININIFKLKKFNLILKIVLIVLFYLHKYI